MNFAGFSRRQAGAGRPVAAMLAAILMSSSCASQAQQEPTGVDRAVVDTREGFGDAVMTPLSDLNLRRAPIPPKLEAIISPYEPIQVNTCAGIADEVRQLTEILGPDIDAPASDDDPTLSDRAGEGAADLALNQVTSAVTGFIPYRSVLRQASGASAHERKLREVYDRGAQKRAYLKGIGASKGCAPPAAPDPRAGIVVPPDNIEYRGD